MTIKYELRRLTADAIFAVEDAHARRTTAGAVHPGPIGRVDFRVLGPRTGAGIRSFAEPTRLALVATESGFSLFFGEVWVTDAAGREHRRRLSDGIYVVQVESDAYQRLPDFDLTLPAPVSVPVRPIDLEPGFGYPFRNNAPLRAAIAPGSCTVPPLQEGRGPTLLRGSLHAPDGSAVAGAGVAVIGLAAPPYRTDDTGQWVLAFPDGHPSGPVTVRVTRPSASVVDVPGVCVVRGREASLRETALRGWVLKSGLPVAGATVAVAGQPGQSRTGGDGGWFYYFPLNQPAITVNLTATLPTGEQLPSTNVPVNPRTTTVTPTFLFP